MPSQGEPNKDRVSAAVALFNRGQFAEAAELAQGLTVEFPDHPFGWKVLGAALKQLGREAEALAPMRRAVALAPGNAEALSNLAATLRELGQLPEAADCLRQALAIRPDLPEAHVNLGNVLTDLGRLDNAVASYRRALELGRDNVVAHNGLGNALARLGRWDEAVASCRRALELQPDYALAHFNLGVALQGLGRLEESVASYRRVLELKPDFHGAWDNLLFVGTYQPDVSATANLEEARRYGALVAKAARPFTDWPNEPRPDRRLRVGLVSGDLGNHPVGYFLECVLKVLAADHANRLEFFAFPTQLHECAVASRIRACCRGWHPAAGLSDGQLAALIRQQGIDLLIDLSGHTGHNRLSMFAWKPAPVQATWLGYLATTGVAAIDYVIADPWALPEGAAAGFTEQVWRLPECYLCFTPPEADVPVAALPARQSGHVTFGCFNNLNKMNDAVVALWARILRAVPASRLYLKTAQLGQGGARQLAGRRFAQHGVDPGRLILEGAVPRAELLASYGRMDIGLDPFPYPGITSTIEALWMGVPVLTLAGSSFLSRQGVSIMQNAGLPEWIAADADDYVSKAVAHAGELELLARTRAGLRPRLLGSPLLDARRFAGHLEAALRGMWTRWCETSRSPR